LTDRKSRTGNVDDDGIGAAADGLEQNIDGVGIEVQVLGQGLLRVSSVAITDRLSVSFAVALEMNRLSIRDGFSRASRSPRVGSRSRERATVPNSKSRSTSTVLLLSSWLKYQAILVATVLTPTPPRAPMTAIRSCLRSWSCGAVTPAVGSLTRCKASVRAFSVTGFTT
jgi:hypothetical protein